MYKYHRGIGVCKRKKKKVGSFRREKKNIQVHTCTLGEEGKKVKKKKKKNPTFLLINQLAKKEGQENEGKKIYMKEKGGGGLGGKTRKKLQGKG